MEAKIEKLVQEGEVFSSDWDQVVQTFTGWELYYGGETICVKFGKDHNDDTYIFIYKQGVKIETVFYYPNRSPKYRVSYYRDTGSVIYSCFYDIEGRLTGPCIGYYSDGTKHFEKNYKRGKPHGEFKEYNENGNLIGFFNCSFGKREGGFKVFYPDSPLIELEGCFRNDKLNGYIHMYYPDTGVKQIEYFHFGDLITRDDYYPNGNLRKNSRYIAGQLDGNIFRYWENGSIKSVTPYEKGKKEGVKRYFENDVLLEEITYERGVQNGDFNVYSSEGELLRTGEYKDGVVMWDQTDKYTRYYKDGWVDMIEHYYDPTKRKYEDFIEDIISEINFLRKPDKKHKIYIEVDSESSE